MGSAEEELADPQSRTIRATIPVSLRTRSSRPVRARTRFDLTRDDLRALLPGEPRFRVDQLWKGLFEQGLELDEISTLSKPLRAALNAEAELHTALHVAREQSTPNGDTIKWLWSLADGEAIESVLMHYRDRSTVCISSQAGCAMGCGFCATGQAGFDRQLRVGEIVEQVVRASRRARESGRRLSNVVFMGMGEPMANYDAVWDSVERIHADIGLSARHLTISTVGIVPGIRRLAYESLPVNLAVSLHSANDVRRNELVPINRTYPLDMLAEACAEYFAATNRRISFEWAMIDGVNDTPIDAEELADYALSLRAHVNLIPLNPTPGWPTTGSRPEIVHRFRDRLEELGVNATIRQNRGVGIDAACGQLRASSQ